MHAQRFYRIFIPLFCLAMALKFTFGSAQASPIQQTDADFAAIDAYVQEQMDEQGFPGMALGIIENGQVAHLQGLVVGNLARRTVE